VRVVAAVRARATPSAWWLAPLLPLWVAVSVVRSHGLGPLGDEPAYLRYGEHLLHGRYAIPGTHDATQFVWHGPGLPALLPPFLLADAPLWVMRLTGPVLLFAAILLFHRLLRLRLSPGWALGGAWLFGLYAPMGEVVGTLHKEPLALALLAAAMIGATRYLDSGRPRHLLLAGAGLTGLVMTRLEYGWVLVVLVPLAAVWALCTRRTESRRMLLVAGLGLAGCVPWLIYTFSLTGQVLYWGNSGGLSLYWMAPHPGQDGAWHAMHSVFRDHSLAAYRHFFRYAKSLPPLPRDLLFRHVAVAEILRDPDGYALNVLANVARGLVAAPISGGVPVLASVFAGMFSLPLLAAVLASVAWLRLRRRRAPERGGLPSEAALFGAFAVLALGLHLLPSTEPRLLLPIVPIALWVTIHTAALWAAERRGAAAS
jgi:hypothetical protein